MSASVTVVIVPREQFSRAQLSLQSVLDATASDYPIIYVDGNSPPDLACDLAMTDRIKVIRRNHYLLANAARNLALPQMRTHNYRLDHRARLLTHLSRINRIIEGSVGKILEKTVVKSLERRHHLGQIGQSTPTLAPN